MIGTYHLVRKGGAMGAEIELIGAIIQQSVDETAWASNCLIAGFKAERDATHAVLSAALESIPHGGTTAEYERGLVRVRMALCPSPRVMDVYRRRADQWLAGEEMDPEPVLWKEADGWV